MIMKSPVILAARLPDSFSEASILSAERSECQCVLLQFRFACPEIANRFGGITDLREHCRALLAGGGLGSEAHMELALEREPEIADVGPLLSIDGVVEAEHILRTGKAQEHLFAGHVCVHAIVGVDVRDVRTDGECSIVALLEE